VKISRKKDEKNREKAEKAKEPKKLNDQGACPNHKKE
jgi:hypothetical protein